MKLVKGLMKMLAVLIVLGVIVYAALVGFVCYKEAHPPEVQAYDAIIVLGAQVLANGEASVQLANRLEQVLKAYEENNCLIITCGARGGDEPMPEADFMKEWLVQKGVPSDRVLAENTSFNTRQNIDNAVALLPDSAAYTFLIVTSDYHLPRALALAEDAGVRAVGIGSPCKPDIINWGRNHLREALAWVKYWGQKYIGLQLE